MLDSLTHENTGVLDERLVQITYVIGWCICAFLLLRKFRLYELPLERYKQLPPNFLRHMTGAFLVFFFIEIFLVPIYIALWQKIHATEKMSSQVTGWITVAAMVVAGVGVLLYYLFLPAETKKVVQGPNEHRLKNFSAGLLTWVFAAPVVLIFTQLMSFIIPLFSHKAQVDQSVVQHMKDIAKYPFLFWSTALGVITIVPIVEEILFRGFLQTWLFDIFGRTNAIFVASLIFAGFHFSYSQGITNLELLPVLFILSCFLGFIYEKQQSIWASIGLHFLFNLVGIIMIASEVNLM